MLHPCLCISVKLTSHQNRATITHTKQEAVLKGMLSHSQRVGMIANTKRNLAYMLTKHRASNTGIFHNTLQLLTRDGGAFNSAKSLCTLRTRDQRCATHLRDLQKTGS